MRLTNYSDKGGCGCKIDISRLSNLLTFENSSIGMNIDSNYLSMEDCALSELGDKNYLLNTLDFFSPPVDEPFLYGKISALNAVSDIYAMGGKPSIGLCILGWPEELKIEDAKKVLEGASIIAKQLNFSISGGHSIINSQPIFGLSISGYVKKKNIKRLYTEESSCQIYITKPIGTGILSSTIKNQTLDNKTFAEFKKVILQSNQIGFKLGKLKYVKAMTDISGFGLLGHLMNICKRSNLNATIIFNKIPKIENLDKYLKKGITTSVTEKNYQKYKSTITKNIDLVKKNLLFDPQTNGGLIILIQNNKIEEFEEFANRSNLSIFHIGETKKSLTGVKINII